MTSNAAHNLFVIVGVDAFISILLGLSLLIVPMTPPRCRIVSYLQECFFYSSAIVLVAALVAEVA